MSDLTMGSVNFNNNPYSNGLDKIINEKINKPHFQQRQDETEEQFRRRIQETIIDMTVQN